MKKLIVTTLVMVVVVAVILLGAGPAIDRSATFDVTRSESSLPTAEAISFFQSRVEADERDAVSATILGELFSRQARETGDVSRLERAEQSLTRALDSVPGYPRAQAALASVLVAQHRFGEALRLAVRADEADPDSGASITVGDAQLALGRYDEAEATYLEALGRFPAPLVSARLAHLDEIHGRLESARSTMDESASSFARSGGSGEAAAWFEMRRGDLAFADGAYEAAADAYRYSLELLENHPNALAGLARSQAALGDRSGAIETYEKAVAVQPLPTILLSLGELYEMEGRIEAASSAFETLEVVAALNEGFFDLSLIFYQADHGSPASALSSARKLAATRPDLFSYDALAWAAFRSGDLETARAAADEAVGTNPAYASMWYHSGAIWAAIGNTTRAIADLERAVALSPVFDPVGSLETMRLLRELRE